MRCPRRLSAMVIAFGLVLSAFVLLPAAHAGGSGGSGSGCKSGSVCVWAKPGYEGRKVVAERPGVSNELARVMNNRASSVKNRRNGDRVAVLWARRDGEGASWCAAGGASVPDLDDWMFDDYASSIELPRTSATLCL